MQQEDEVAATNEVVVADDVDTEYNKNDLAVHSCKRQNTCVLRQDSRIATLINDENVQIP